MKLQTELLENRVARLKVEVEGDDLEQAKKQAARRLAGKVNIPGFRKGKAPYNIVVRYLGEGAILEEAVDDLGPKLYSEALDEAALQPYGPGSLENIEAGPPLTMIFTVPLVPTIDLGEYRALRREFKEPEVTDEMVNDSLRMLVDSRAVVEPKTGPAEAGDRATLDVYGELVPTPAAEGEAASEEAPEEEDAEAEENTLFDSKDWQYVLGDEDEELMPGFSQALEGIAAGETREFDLTFPTDAEAGYDEGLMGRTVNFKVTCKEVSARHLPTQNDDFAKQVSNGEVETLLDLRIKTRENLSNMLTHRYEHEYADQALDAVVEQAKIEYPEVMVEEFIDRMIGSLEQNLGQRGLTLDDFLKMNQLETPALREQYRERAIARLKRSLALGELVNRENVTVEEEAINDEVSARSEYLSQGNAELRKALSDYLNRDEGRNEIALDLVSEKALHRLVEIAKGEAPALEVAPTAEELEAASAEAVEQPAAVTEESADESGEKAESAAS